MFVWFVAAAAAVFGLVAIIRFVFVLGLVFASVTVFVLVLGG
jgi:hypothetical protein